MTIYSYILYDVTTYIATEEHIRHKRDTRAGARDADASWAPGTFIFFQYYYVVLKNII